MTQGFRPAMALVICSCLVSTSSSASDVGVVMTTGTVRVDGLEVPGSSAIFSGSVIAAGDVNSILQFRDGTSAVVWPGATIVVYRERSVLRRGIVMQQGIGKHSVLANGLTISSQNPDAVTLVGVRDDLHFEVMARQGESQVSTPEGRVVARLEPGDILSIDLSQADGASENQKEIKLCGDLDEKYQLTDALSNTVYQLRGTGLDPYVKKSVRVTGTLLPGPSPSGLQIVVVSRMKKQDDHPCKKGAIVLPSPGLLAPLILIAWGGTLLGLGVSGAFHGPSPSPVTPTVP